MAWKLFTDSEIATILHALRLFQDDLTEGCFEEEGCDHFEDARALTSEEIDVLCERINLDGVAWDSRAVSNPEIAAVRPADCQGHDAWGDQGLMVDAKTLAEQGPIVASIEAAEKEK